MTARPTRPISDSAGDDMLSIRFLVGLKRKAASIKGAETRGQESIYGGIAVKVHNRNNYCIFAHINNLRRSAVRLKATMVIAIYCIVINSHIDL